MEELITTIILPMVANKEALMIKQMPFIEGEPMEIVIIADKEDIARLIGKGGMVASAIREVVSIKARLDNVKVHVKFESYDE